VGGAAGAGAVEVLGEREAALEAVVSAEQAEQAVRAGLVGRVDRADRAGLEAGRVDLEEAGLRAAAPGAASTTATSIMGTAGCNCSPAGAWEA
jgi:hypothetical protein